MGINREDIGIMKEAARLAAVVAEEEAKKKAAKEKVTAKTDGEIIEGAESENE